MADLTLSIAINDYDHIRDLVDGKVKAEGIRLELDKDMEVEEIFARFTETRCWDVSEMSLARYVSLTSQNDDNLAGIPVTCPGKSHSFTCHRFNFTRRRVYQSRSK